MVVMENTNISLKNKFYPFRKFVHSILVGVIGSVLLVIFFASLMSLGTITKLLPWVIGFNAALTGYNLINKAGKRLKYKRIYAVVSGITLAIITGVLLNIISFYLMGGYLIYFSEFMFLILIGSICSGLGSILAIKYLNLE